MHTEVVALLRLKEQAFFIYLFSHCTLFLFSSLPPSFPVACNGMPIIITVSIVVPLITAASAMPLSSRYANKQRIARQPCATALVRACTGVFCSALVMLSASNSVFYGTNTNTHLACTNRMTLQISICSDVTCLDTYILTKKSNYLRFFVSIVMIACQVKCIVPVIYICIQQMLLYRATCIAIKVYV